MTNCGYIFPYISERLQQQKYIALLAIQQFPYAFIHLPQKFKEDQDIIFNVLSRNGSIYGQLSEELKSNCELLKVDPPTYDKTSPVFGS